MKILVSKESLLQMPCYDVIAELSPQKFGKNPGTVLDRFVTLQGFFSNFLGFPKRSLVVFSGSSAFPMGSLVVP